MISIVASKSPQYDCSDAYSGSYLVSLWFPATSYVSSLYTSVYSFTRVFCFSFFLFISLPSFQLAFRPRISRATTITERFIRPSHFHYHRLISSTVQFPLYLFLSSVYDRCGRYLLSYRAVPNCTSCVNCRGAYREGANQKIQFRRPTRSSRPLLKSLTSPILFYSPYTHRQRVMITHICHHLHFRANPSPIKIARWSSCLDLIQLFP